MKAPVRGDEGQRSQVVTEPERPAGPERKPRCWPVRPHVRRGNKLYCATCDQLIMTFL